MSTAATLEQQTGTSVLSNDPDWWRGAVIYQIYPRSYADSNGDGIGDLAGIKSKLPYIQSLGVDAIWISPFMKSPMDDFGYDVSDYRDVEPMFGSLQDFKDLIEDAHGRGLRVMIDLVISHTSEQHVWFKESRQNKTNPKADWYVWADAMSDGNPPNNWLSIFGGSAWQWDTRRCQYYLHNFLRSQPDLNFHNEEVQEAVLDAARFWLELGVDGFRLDTVNFYFHDKELRSNPGLDTREALTTAPASNPYGYQQHLYDKSQPENLRFLEKLRKVMDEFPCTTSVGEVGADGEAHDIIAAYTKGNERLHMCYSFELLSGEPKADYIRESVSNMLNGIESGWASWAMSNHDVVRVGSRLSDTVDTASAAPLLVAVNASLRGSPCLYQGEELGFLESDVPFEKLQDPYGIEFWPEFKGRDGCRTPMAWDSSAQGGFSSGTPWLPVNKDHIASCVATQERDRKSCLNIVRAFLNWRRQHLCMLKGTLEFIDMPNGVLGFIRQYEGEAILCMFNMTEQVKTILLSEFEGAEAFSNTGFSFKITEDQVTLEGWQAVFMRLQVN